MLTTIHMSEPDKLTHSIAKLQQKVMLAQYKMRLILSKILYSANNLTEGRQVPDHMMLDRTRYTVV